VCSKKRTKKKEKEKEKGKEEEEEEIWFVLFHRKNMKKMKK